MDVSEQHRIAAAEDEHWWYRSTRHLLRSWLAPWTIGARVAVDIGCGPGGNGAWLGEAAFAVGLDVDAVALRYVADRHRGLAPVRASATDLPIASGTVDVAQIVTVLYHVADDAAAVREAARVLRPGGALLIVEPAFAALARQHDVVTHGLRRYRRAEVARLARDAGLRVQRCTYAKAFLVPAAAAIALRDRIWPTPPSPAQGRSDLSAHRLDRVATPVADALCAAEHRWLRRHDLPVGTSVFVLAVKPER